MPVLFISTNYVKENSDVDENVADKIIKMAIIKAQDMQLQEIIGTDLLNDLKDEVEASSVSAANQTLLDDFVLPFLLRQTVTNACISMLFKIRNKGIGKMNDENFTPVDTADLNLVLRHYESDAQFHGERMRRYLIDNTSTYPLFLSGNTDLWKVRPGPSAYQTGLFLGNKRKPYRTGYNQTSLYNERFYDGPCCYYR